MKFETTRVMSRCCASIAILMIIVSACVDTEYFAADTIPTDQIHVEKVDSVTIRYSDSATVKVIVTAPTLWRINELSNIRQEFPNGTKVEFLDNAGEISSQLTADYAIRYEAKSGIKVQGNVIWTSIDGKRLESEELIWDEKDKRIHTQKLVHIITPEQDVYGYGLEADQDFNTWSILAPIGDLKIEDLKN